MWYLLLSAVGTFCVSTGFFALLDYWHERRGTLRQVKYGSDETIDWPTYVKVAKRSMWNIVTVLAPMSAIFRWTGTTFGSFSHTLTLPQGVSLMLASVVVEDLLFYLAHRALHTRLLYRYHKLHHQLVDPFAVGVFYSSAPENALVNFGPVLAVPFITHLSEPWLVIWINMAMLSGVVSHCGYRIPFVQFHDTHHKRNTINFGVGGLSDWVFGTYMASDVATCSDVRVVVTNQQSGVITTT